MSIALTDRLDAAITELSALRAEVISLETNRARFSSRVKDCIKCEIARRYEVSVAELTSQRRPARIAWPRQIAMWLTRELAREETLEGIGAAYGGRDHGTVVHAIKRVSDERDVNLKFRAELELLQREIRAEAEKSLGRKLSVTRPSPMKKGY